MVFLATKAAVAATIVGIGVTFGALSYLARHRQGGVGGARNYNGSHHASPNGAFPFPISFQKDSSQYNPQSLPNLHFNLPRLNLSRLFGGGQLSASDCNCKLIYDCSTFFGGSSQSFRFRRTCGFQGFQRKICCDEGPFFSTPPPTVALDEIKSVHAQLGSNCNHGLEGHSKIKCNCDEHRHLFDDLSQDDEGSEPEGSFRSSAGGISTETVKIDATTKRPDEMITSTSSTKKPNRKRIEFPDVNEYFRDDKPEEGDDQYQSTFLPIRDDDESVARIDNAFDEKSTMNGERTSTSRFPDLKIFFPESEGSDHSSVLATTTLNSAPAPEITTSTTTKSPEEVVKTTVANEIVIEDFELPQGRLAPGKPQVADQVAKNAEMESANVLALSVSDVKSSTMSPASVIEDMTTSVNPSEEQSTNGKDPLQTSAAVSTSTEAARSEGSTASGADLLPDGEGSDLSRTLATTTPHSSQVMESEITSKYPEITTAPTSAETTTLPQTVKTESDSDAFTTTNSPQVPDSEISSKSSEMTTTSTERESSSGIVSTTMSKEVFTEAIELPQGRLAPGRTTVSDQISKNVEVKISDVLSITVPSSSSFPSDMEDLITSTKSSEKEAITQQSSTPFSATTQSSEPEDSTTFKADFVPDGEESDPSKTLAVTTLQVMEGKMTSKSPDITTTPTSVETTTLLPTVKKESDSDGISELIEIPTTLQPAPPTPQEYFPDVTETIIHGSRRGTNQPQSLQFEMDLVNSDKSEEVSTTPLIQTSTSVSQSISRGSERVRVTNSTSSSVFITDSSTMESLTTLATTDAETTVSSPISEEGESPASISMNLPTVPSERRPFALSGGQGGGGETTTQSPLPEASQSRRSQQSSTLATAQNEDQPSQGMITTTDKSGGDEDAIESEITTTTEKKPDYDLSVNPMEVNVEKTTSSPSTIPTPIIPSSSETTTATPTTEASSLEDAVTTAMSSDDSPFSESVTDHIAKNSEMGQADIEPLAVDVGTSTMSSSTEMEGFTTTEKLLEEQSINDSSTQSSIPVSTSTEALESEDSTTFKERLLLDLKENDLLSTLESTTTSESVQVMNDESTSNSREMTTTTTSKTTEGSSSEDTVTPTMINEAFTDELELPQGRIAPGRTTVTDQLAKKAEMEISEVLPLSSSNATQAPFPTTPYSNDMEDLTTSEKATEEQSTKATDPQQSSTIPSTSTELTEPEGSTTLGGELLQDGEASDSLKEVVTSTVKSSDVQESEMTTGAPEVAETTETLTSTFKMEATTLTPAEKDVTKKPTMSNVEEATTVASYQDDAKAQDDEISPTSEPLSPSTSTQEPETTSEQPDSTEPSLLDDIMSMISSLTTISPEESSTSELSPTTTTPSQETTTLETIAGTLKIIEVPMTTPTTEKVDTENRIKNIMVTTGAPIALVESEDNDEGTTAEVMVEPTTTGESLTEKLTDDPASPSTTPAIMHDLENKTTTAIPLSTDVPLDEVSEIVTTTQIAYVADDDEASSGPSEPSTYSTVPSNMDRGTEEKEVPTTTEAASNEDEKEASTVNLLKAEEIRHQQTESYDVTPIPAIKMTSETPASADQTSVFSAEVTTTESIVGETIVDKNEVTTTEAGQSEKPTDETTTETSLDEALEMDDEIQTTTLMETPETSTVLTVTPSRKLDRIGGDDNATTMDSISIGSGSSTEMSDGTTTTEQSEATAATASESSLEDDIMTSEPPTTSTAGPTTPFSLEGWSTTYEPMAMDDEDLEATTGTIKKVASSSKSQFEATTMSDVEVEPSYTPEPSLVMAEKPTEPEAGIKASTMMTTEAFKAKEIEVTTNVIISSTWDNGMNRLLETTTMAPSSMEGSSQSSTATEESGISTTEEGQASTNVPAADEVDSTTTQAPGPDNDRTLSATSNNSIDETTTASSTLPSDIEATTTDMDMETTTEMVELPQPRIAPGRIPPSSLIQIADLKPLSTTTEAHYPNQSASTTEESIEMTTSALDSEMLTESGMSTPTMLSEMDDIMMEIDSTSTPKDEESSSHNPTDSVMDEDNTIASSTVPSEEVGSTSTPSPNESTSSHTADSTMEEDNPTSTMPTGKMVSSATPPSNETHASYGATTEYPDSVDMDVTQLASESTSEMPEAEGTSSTPIAPSTFMMTTDNPDFDDENGPVTEITKSIRREPDTDKTIVKLTSMTATVRTKVVKTVNAVRSGSESSVSELTTESPSTTERTTTEVEPTQEVMTESGTTEAEVPAFDDVVVQQTTQYDNMIGDIDNTTESVPDQVIFMERTTPSDEYSLPTTEIDVIQIMEDSTEEALQNQTTEGSSQDDFIPSPTERLEEDSMLNSSEFGAGDLEKTTTEQDPFEAYDLVQERTTGKETAEDDSVISISTENNTFLDATTQKGDIPEDKEQATTVGGGLTDAQTGSPKETTEVWTTEGILRETTEALSSSEKSEGVMEVTDSDAGTTTTEKEETSSFIPSNLDLSQMDMDEGNDTISEATTWPASLEVRQSESVVMDLKLERTTEAASPPELFTSEIPAFTEPSASKTRPIPEVTESTSEKILTEDEIDMGQSETSQILPTSTFNPNMNDKVIGTSQSDDVVDFDVRETSSQMPEDSTEGTTVTIPNKSDEEYSTTILDDVYDAIFGASGRSARVHNFAQSGKSPSTTISSTPEARTTTTPPPPFTLEVKIGPYDARSLFASDSTSDEKQLAGKISNVVSQLLLTTHKNFHLLPNFIECAGARGRTGRRKTKVLHFDTDNYPWMARIGFREPRGILFPCAGTIISKRYILTSAHCATRMPSDSTKMEILLEGAKLAARGMSELEQSQYKYTVEEVVLHPNYDKTSRENDLALIRLSKEIPNFNGSSEVKPICLPFEDGYGVWDSLPEVGETAYLGGWGYGLKNMAAKVEEMEEAAVTIWPNENCTYLYRGDYQKKITPQHICAYGKVEKDACRGDFGGPLMALMTRQRIFFQIGIVSYGPRCGYGVPGVYTRVSNYLSWILDSMRP